MGPIIAIIEIRTQVPFEPLKSFDRICFMATNVIVNEVKQNTIKRTIKNGVILLFQRY